MVDESQISFFQENGYLSYGSVLQMDEIKELRRDLNKVIQIEFDGGDDTEPEFRYGHRRKNEDEVGAITQFVNMWKRQPSYERLLHHPIISGIACALLGVKRVRLWHDQIISKPPKDNGKFNFHQDFYFWPLDHPQIVTCWLALDDATIDSGCMHVIPRSHIDEKFGPIARAEGAYKTERELISQKDIDFGTPVELMAGECMFHHCLNFHATPPNITNQQRRAHIMIFMAEGTKVNLSQSANHILVSRFEVDDGQELIGSRFPLSEPEIWDDWRVEKAFANKHEIRQN